MLLETGQPNRLVGIGKIGIYFDAPKPNPQTIGGVPRRRRGNVQREIVARMAVAEFVDAAGLKPEAEAQ